MWEPEPGTVARAREGDLGAFEELVRAYQADVYRLALSLVRDRATAEDVTQDTFVHAWRSLGRFRGASRFSTWLLRIARNASVDAIRRRARRERIERDAVAAQPVPDPSLRAALRAAVDGLPHDLREAFVLVEVFGLSYEETCGVLGIPAGTLKSRMHRTRRILVGLLAEQEDAREL